MSIKTLIRKLLTITITAMLAVSVLPTGFSTLADTSNTDTYSVSGEINGFSWLEDELLPVAVVSITPEGSKTPEYVAKGTDAYSFESVAPGEYNLTIAARGEYVTHEYKLTIDDADVVLDTSINQLGDVNHDGVVSEEDCEHMNEPEMSDYDVLLADVNNDGTVDEKDENLIRQYSNGEISGFPRKEVIISEECQKAIDEKLSVDEEHVLDGSELIVTLDEEFPLEYFLVMHEVKGYEVFIGENEWGIDPFIELCFKEDYSIVEEAALIAENTHVISIHPHYFSELTDPLTEPEGEKGFSSDHASIDDFTRSVELPLNPLAETNELSLNDTYFPEQIDYYTDMGLLEAWDTVNDNFVRKAKIAIIDGDLNYYHSDLVNVIDPDQCFDAINFNYNHQESWSPDGTYWYDFTLYPYYPTNMLIHHGTAVTSLIVAEADNQEGIAGAASAGTNEVADVFFYHCAILNGYIVDKDDNAVYRAIICAIREDVDVINMSFRETSASVDPTKYALLNAAYNQGITLVAAGGNYGSFNYVSTNYHENGDGVNYPNYPSDWEQCIAVASLAYSDSEHVKESKYRRATYSSYNAYKDISAYGTNVCFALSTNINQNTYAWDSGTSFAAPLITSVVALMISVNPSLTNEQIFDIITMTASDITYSGNYVNDDPDEWGDENAVRGYDVYTGYGMANAARCVEEALQLRTSNHICAIYPDNVNIPTNSNYQLTAKVVPNNIYNNSFTWSSSDSTIASVDQNGVVTAHKYGTVTITATSNVISSLSDSVTVQTRYYDVNNPARYYYDAVYWAADNDITHGYNGVYFAPKGVCDRKSIVLFLWRMEGRPAVQGTLNFIDCNYGHNSDTYKAILWAYTEGITVGYNDGTFRPDDPVARKDAIIMLYRVAGRPAVSGSMPFPDVAALNYSPNGDTYKAILWAYNTGITHVSSGGNFNPLENCKRAEIVTFIYRYAHLQ
ncbi:MAG: S8 family serine peptidase [Lachnospiraceae bacterium]|nr:S8 family serine peptidase [Lachnospiraceae bacterium]